METLCFGKGNYFVLVPLLEMLQNVDYQGNAQKQRYQAAGHQHYFMFLQSWCGTTMRCILVLHFVTLKGGFTCLFDASPPTTEEHVYDGDAP